MGLRIFNVFNQWYAQYNLTSIADINTKSFITLAVTTFLCAAVAINNWDMIKSLSWGNNYVAYASSTNNNYIIADWVILGLV